MMRAEAIKSIGEYSSRYPHAEDHDMFMRISELGRIENLREVILDYRFHGGNVSVQKLAQQERNAALAEIDNVRAARKKHGKRALRLSSNMFEGHCHTEQVEAVFDRGEARLRHWNRLAGLSPGRQ